MFLNNVPEVYFFFFFFSSDLLRAVDWLVCYTLDKSLRKVESLSLNNGVSPFEVKNAAQVYHLRTLAIVYIEVSP